MEKTKLLYIGDAAANSGFSTVSSGLLRGLHSTGKYEILQLGINYNDTMPWNEPWKVIPAGFPGLSPVSPKTIVTDDPYGTLKANLFVESFDPDIAFVNNDYPIGKMYMEDSKTRKPTAFAKHRSTKVLYSPVDSEPVPRPFASIAKMYELNIAYSYWHRSMMTEHDELFALMPVLYHGYDPETFYPMDKREARHELAQIFHKHNSEIPADHFEKKFQDAFIVYFVGTNQFRKDIPCLFRAYADFREEVEDTYLIPHTNAVPVDPKGWHLQHLQELTGVTKAVLMENANEFSADEMRIFYNAASVLAYPTRGEGFGLPSLEAMACKTPVIATNFGPQYELHRDGRGYFIDVRDVIPGDFAAWSYYVLPDHRSLYKQLKFVHDNPEEAQETAERAYEWAKDLTWENQAKQLDGILDKLPRGIDRDDWIQEHDSSTVGDADTGSGPDPLQ